jgi:hypothetical protein
MYDENHRYKGISSITETERVYQKGIWENLLCSDCEALFSGFESYAARVFGACGMAKGMINSETVKGEVSFQNLDYPNLKLFFLSLLWRFAVTSRPEFSGTNLGPHRDALRKMLLAKDPGDALTYPFCVIWVMWDGKHVNDFMVPPARAKIDGRHVWSFVVAGILVSFFVSNRKLSGVPLAGVLLEDGTLLTKKMELVDIDFLRRYALNLAAAGPRKASGR